MNEINLFFLQLISIVFILKSISDFIFWYLSRISNWRNMVMFLRMHFLSLSMYIYIYIHVWLNNNNTFCLYNFIKILSSSLISVLVSGWNWWMMTYERFENAWDNFDKFFHQFQPETKTLIRKLEGILIKLYRQNVSLLFNQICLNERLLPNHTHTHIYIYIYIYIYI